MKGKKKNMQSLKMEIQSKEQLLTYRELVECSQMCHMWNVKIFQSVMYLVTQLGMQVFYQEKKNTLLQNTFTFIFPIETTEDLAAFFFFI